MQAIGCGSPHADGPGLVVFDIQTAGSNLMVEMPALIAERFKILVLSEDRLKLNQSLFFEEGLLSANFYFLFGDNIKIHAIGHDTSYRKADDCKEYLEIRQSRWFQHARQEIDDRQHDDSRNHNHLEPKFGVSEEVIGQVTHRCNYNQSPGGMQPGNPTGMAGDLPS